MTTLRTILPPVPSSWQLQHSNSVMLIGSCFTEHIGKHLLEAGFNVCQNPFGILYNPLSIRACLERVAEERYFTAEELVFHEGRYHSMLHHGHFSATSEAETLEQINTALQAAHDFLLQPELRLLLTLGTAWVYEQNGKVVGNCHRLPEKTFQRRRITVEEAATALHESLQAVRRLNPTAECVMTVSPIRHMRDGLHENQISKATLHLAIDQLVQQGQTDYYPAYELLIDDLRDYRFYADDYCHPSPLAIDYIWDHFQQCYCTPATQNQSRINEKNYKTQNYVKLTT